MKCFCFSDKYVLKRVSDKVLTSPDAIFIIKLLVVFRGKITLHMLPKATC